MSGVILIVVAIVVIITTIAVIYIAVYRPYLRKQCDRLVDDIGNIAPYNLDIFYLWCYDDKNSFGGLTMYSFAFANPAQFAPAWWQCSGLTLSCTDFS